MKNILERQMRKYEHQGGIFSNKILERDHLVQLLTRILQILSSQAEIDEVSENLIFALQQTRHGLRHPPSLKGTGPLYQGQKEPELLEDTFYALVFQQLLQPYRLDSTASFEISNLSFEGQKFRQRLVSYAFRE
ncbi:hypothetical protein HU830_01420 [Lactobacillus sp. DCY120]|uniref:Uncharacterized protein n=1 Tax=Bombilactobacillus apium TaxID=2675299 RepID=A0A850RAM4_9LACO|nr:hypothetical protein [Bombilactobacillus apium]NVY95868.1 hypothetical protein [Bombilactobacillus apium]